MARTADARTVSPVRSVGRFDRESCFGSMTVLYGVYSEKRFKLRTIATHCVLRRPAFVVCTRDFKRILLLFIYFFFCRCSIIFKKLFSNSCSRYCVCRSKMLHGGVFVFIAVTYVYWIAVTILPVLKVSVIFIYIMGRITISTSARNTSLLGKYSLRIYNQNHRSTLKKNK